MSEKKDREMAVEEIQDEIERILRKSSHDVLVEVGRILKVLEEELEGSAVQLRQSINGVFDLVEDEDEKLAMFASIEPAIPEIHKIHFAKLKSEEP